MNIDVETISADELRGYIDQLLEQDMENGIEVDLVATYLLTLKDGTSPTKKALCEALYYVLSSGYEIRLFLDSMRTASELGKYSNLYKYLAIQIYENLNEMPRVLNEIWKSAASEAEVDIPGIKESSKRFLKDLRGQIKLLKLDNELYKVRNHAGGHHFDKDKNISYLLEVNSFNRGAWGQGGEFYNNAIVALGLYTCVILYNLSKDLRAADKSGVIDALDAYILFMRNNADYLSEYVEVSKRYRPRSDS